MRIESYSSSKTNPATINRQVASPIKVDQNTEAKNMVNNLKAFIAIHGENSNAINKNS